MKQLFLFILFFQSVFSYAKEKTAIIHFDGYRAIAETKTWKWKINGVELSFVNSSVTFTVHYPKQDTIIYSKNDTAKKELIITRFTPGQFYTITFSGCCMAFDIFGDDHYPKKHNPTWPDTLGMKLENGTVQFKALNYTDTTMLIGSFGDIYGGYTGGVLLTSNTLSTKTDPFLLPYSNYVNHVIIGKAQYVNMDTLDEEWYNREFHIIVKDVKNKEAVYLKEFVNFQCRFFNRENLVVIYDCKTSEVKLEIQE